MREIKTGIFWEDSCVHSWTDVETKKRSISNSDMYIFNADHSSIDFNQIDMRLSEEKSAMNKLNYLCELNSNNNKNRFAVL